MKINLRYDDDTNMWFEGGDYEVELPDAIVKDWHETQAHLQELFTYFTEKAQPQIDAERERRTTEWRRAHPDRARVQDMINDRWSRLLLDQSMRQSLTLPLFQKGKKLE